MIDLSAPSEVRPLTRTGRVAFRLHRLVLKIVLQQRNIIIMCTEYKKYITQTFQISIKF